VEKILNQDEIDRLFRAAQGSASKPAAAKKHVQDCDFRQAGQLTKDQVRQVTLLHEAFAPNLANSLGAYLRVAFQTSLVAVEQLAYGEFLGRLPEQTYFAMLMLLPLGEAAAIQIDLSLAFPMIDLLLGGPGQGIPEPRDLTEIEEEILESVVLIVYRELQSTWQIVLPLEFKVGERLKQGPILSLMPASERILNLSFEIRMTDARGNLNLIFPAVVSNMLLRKLALQGMAQRRRPSVDDAARLRERLLDSKLTLELALPHVQLSIRDIVDLKPGNVLPLRQSVHDSMSVSVNDRPIFTGIPVGCGTRRGGLIQEKVTLLNSEEKQNR
jgi:flagellar motor switch protein FliM